ncbi:MAG: CRTAC1 family protein [Vicinamibacterales bacterium]
MATRALLRPILTLLFAGLLVAVVILNRSAVDGGRVEPVSRTGPADTIARFGFHLEDVAASAGASFVHHAPTFDSRLDHIMPMVAAMGAAVAIADFDHDGWQDFYVTDSAEGSANGLYRNNGDGTFSDVAAALGVADVNQTGTGASMGAVWGDYDNDGYEDLFLYKYGRPELFHNDKGKAFTRVTDRAGLPDWVNANSAVWLDYDADGRLDLFLAGYWPEHVNLWKLETTRVMPESFEYAENGGRKYLLRNRGDGTFEDTTAAAGIDTRRWTLAVAAADYSGSGRPDLFLANDYGVSQLFANRDGKFVDVSRESGVGRAPKSGMSASIGDIFNDGRLSIYQTNISEPGVLIQGNNLWVPKQPGMLTFENLATSLGIDLGGWSWGAQFGDVNNDGRTDLYLVNGYVSGQTRESYWYDFSQIAVGHSAIIADAANWPPMRDRTLSGYQPKRLWLNDGAGRFTDVAQVAGATDTYDGRAVALADFTNSGTLDIVVANQRGPLLLYRNRVQPGRHWIELELEGTMSNRSAIGARVELHWDGQVQTQEVSGGSGFSAQNQRRLHYGLGVAATVDRAVIRWPSGRRQTLETPAVDTLHRIKEPA